MGEAIRADYRFMKNLLSTTYSDSNVSATPEDLDKVSVVFKKAGGSWKKIFHGSVEDIALLKKVLKAAISKGHITKSSDWGE